MLNARLLAPLLLLLLGGCRTAPEQPVFTVVSSAFQAQRPGPGTFLPMGVTERLIEIGQGGTLQPGLATSWTVDESGCRWRLTLRSGVRFHDGSILTGKTAAQSLLAFLDESVLALAGVKSIQGQEQQLSIETREPVSYLPALLTSRTCALVSIESQSQPFIVGSGPYRITGKAASSFEFEAFADYWGGKPAVPKTRLQVVDNAEARFFLARTREAQLVAELRPVAATYLERQKTSDFQRVPIPRMRALMVNHRHPILRDVRIRKALSLALDREGMATALLRSPESAAGQLMPPSAASWHHPDLPKLSYDPALALRTLQECGWQRNSKGWLSKDERPLEFELLTYSGRPELVTLAIAIQDQLKRVGIRVKVELVTPSVLSRRSQNGTLELALYSRNYGAVSDPAVVLASDIGPEAGPWGARGWKHPEAEAILQSYKATFDESKRSALRHRLVEILQDELPMIPVAWYESTMAVAPGVEGFQLRPYDYFWLRGVAWES